MNTRLDNLMGKKVLITLICLMTLVVVVLVNREATQGVTRAQVRPETSVGSPYLVAQASPDMIQDGLSAVISRVRPAVVSITAHSPIHEGFRRQGLQVLNPYQVGSTWMGSGVIVDPNGIILTSRQVVGDARRVRVALFRSGSNSFWADRVATDPQTGLVLLRLPFGGDLPFAVLGDSSRVRSGDLVVALGSPFGLAESATQGIVSCKRDISLNNNQLNVLQTDAAINQGNCGGPLVNIHAEVVGLNIAIYSTDSAFSGIGFAIPSNQAREFVMRSIGH